MARLELPGVDGKGNIGRAALLSNPFEEGSVALHRSRNAYMGIENRCIQLFVILFQATPCRRRTVLSGCHVQRYARRRGARVGVSTYQNRSPYGSIGLRAYVVSLDPGEASRSCLRHSKYLEAIQALRSEPRILCCLETANGGDGLVVPARSNPVALARRVLATMCSSRATAIVCRLQARPCVTPKRPVVGRTAPPSRSASSLRSGLDQCSGSCRSSLVPDAPKRF